MPPYNALVVSAALSVDSARRQCALEYSMKDELTANDCCRCLIVLLIVAALLWHFILLSDWNCWSFLLNDLGLVIQTRLLLRGSFGALMLHCVLNYISVLYISLCIVKGLDR